MGGAGGHRPVRAGARGFRPRGVRRRPDHAEAARCRGRPGARRDIHLPLAASPTAAALPWDAPTGPGAAGRRSPRPGEPSPMWPSPAPAASGMRRATAADAPLCRCREATRSRGRPRAAARRWCPATRIPPGRVRRSGEWPGPTAQVVAAPPRAVHPVASAGGERPRGGFGAPVGGARQWIGGGAGAARGGFPQAGNSTFAAPGAAANLEVDHLLQEPPWMPHTPAVP